MDAVAIMLALADLYVLAGILFGVAFVIRGANRVDPAAAGAGILVRAMWLPAAVALWPVLLKKWMSA